METLDASTAISVIPGDGIGPEVVSETLQLLIDAGAKITPEYVPAGEQVFKQGIKSGVPTETIDSIARTKVVLKGPLATPVGYGEKSANVTLRKFFETFANIRPARELPGVHTPFAGKGIDLVVVRENIEDLYAGIEHMQTPNVAQCLKLISRLGCQRISQASFDYARSAGYKLVTVATKANIMKLTEGMLKNEFEEIAKKYPEIATNHLLIDNCAHQMVINPEKLGVIVTSNMNGDIISDLASGLVGGLGFAPSANLGYDIAMFEPVHGTAPDIAGADRANPTAMILSGIMLLQHIGQSEEAQRLEQALFTTLQDGIKTHDMDKVVGVGCKQFAQSIRERLGSKSTVKTKFYEPLSLTKINSEQSDVVPSSRNKVGVDVFIETTDRPQLISEKLIRVIVNTPYELKMISNRGTQVWPASGTTPTTVDHYRCRFMINNFLIWHSDSVLDLLAKIGQIYRWMHVEKLEQLDGEDSFTKAQGEK